MPIAHLSRQIRPPNGRLLGGDEVAFAPDSEALRMRYEHLAIREEVLRERETAVRDREAAAERRETAAERREVAAERKEAGLCQREADLRQREERREADLSRREELLDGFARASGIDRAQMGSSSAWERSRSHFHSSSAFPAANSKRRHADPMDDVQALYESYQVLGGVVPLGVLVAQVEALQQAATRLEAAADVCDAQVAQLEERGKLPLTESRETQRKDAVGRLKAKRAHLKEGCEQLRARYRALRDDGVARFVPMLLQTVSTDA